MVQALHMTQLEGSSKSSDAMSQRCKHALDDWDSRPSELKTEKVSTNRYVSHGEFHEPSRARTRVDAVLLHLDSIRGLS